MGKQYYCDYCERSFADGAENRKKHLVSVHHQKVRKAHYDLFRDAATVLNDELQKKPCRKFNQMGHCDYGPGCKYSHLTASDIHNLQEQAKIDEQKDSKNSLNDSEISEVDVKTWLESVMKKKDKIVGSGNLSTSMNPPLPEILRNIPNLPPSLIPPKPVDISEENIAEWGR